jgi:hypothetical protein
MALIGTWFAVAFIPELSMFLVGLMR